MTGLSRRSFIVLTAAAASARALPKVAQSPPAKRILTVVYDKSLGMMRAIDRVVR